MRRVTTLLARQRLVVVAATTTITTIKVAHANAAHELSRPPPRAASQFAVERALEHAKALALAKRQNLIRRIYSHCRRCARLLYAWARLSSLRDAARPRGARSSSVAQRAALDELWWRYMLWATQTAGPTAVKLAQWASSREDRFPAAFCERFSHLQDRAPAHAWEETAAALARSLGADWGATLAVDREPVGTGCVAQVHRATLLRDVPGGGAVGDEVAVKVIHPAARHRVATDLELMRGAAVCVERLVPMARWCSIAVAVDEFAKTLSNQMDMRLEADNLERLDANFAKVDDISFPRPRPALTSADVLVEDFVRGASMKDVLRNLDALEPRVKAALSAIGVKAVCKMIFHDNLLHGDMHPGNILVTDLSKPSVCFLDAGICVELGDTEHQHFVDVLAALMRHDGDRAGRLMIAGNERFETLGPRARFNGFDTEAEWADAQDAFCRTLAHITSKTQEEAFFQKIGDYTTRIFAEASACRVALEGYFVSTAIAIRVMEGVANALDPDVKIGQLAIPWMMSSSVSWLRKDVFAPFPQLAVRDEDAVAQGDARDGDGGVARAQERRRRVEDVVEARPRGAEADAANITPIDQGRCGARAIEDAVRSAGLDVETCASVALPEPSAVSILLLGASGERLVAYAGAAGVPARLDPARLRARCAALEPPIRFEKRPAAGLALADQNGLYPPFLHIYADVVPSAADLCLPFVDHNRHKVILRMLTAQRFDDGRPSRGAALNVRAMDTCRPFDTFAADSDAATVMVLHESLTDPGSTRRALHDDWIARVVPPWRTPVPRIREYLGDQMGFYFLFVSTLATHCLPLGLCGVAVFAATYAAPLSEASGRQIPTVVFAPCVVLAMGAFLADFRRKQARRAKQWGSFAWASAKPRTRPSFRGAPMTDPVFGHVALDFRSAERRRRQFVSWVVVGALLCLVVIVIVAINVFRDTAEGDERFEFAGTDTSPHVALLLNIAQVQILNAVFSHVARALTLYENWRTDVQYTNALIGKLFLFKFVNTFASVADVAFIKGFRKDNCGAPGGCLHALGVQVGTLFVSGGAAALVAQVVVPTLKQRRVRAKTSGDYGDDGALRAAAALLCGAGLYAQLKADAYKLLWIHRRPVPMEVSSIGAWEGVFDRILKLAGRLACFVLGSMGLYAALEAVDLFHPPVDEGVAVQLRRQAVYNQRVVHGAQGDSVYDEAPVADGECADSRRLAAQTHVV
ncbi:kinase [Aureococcus anophagefferens]|nr:kinase [Aureococcus anophagefferens]